MFFPPGIVKAKAAGLLPVFLCFFLSINAQVADTLNEIKIKGKRRQQSVSNDDRVNTFSPGQKIKTIDSLTLQQYQFQNMANLLSQQTPVFVKSYGFNALSTLNFRGASAAQSQVFWNGVPIQNAALGVADVSLLPVSMMHKVNIVYGGSAALWGSGNVGGALLIENNKPVFDSNGYTTHSVSAVAGSFGQYQLGLRSAISSGRWYISVNAFGQQAKNDFQYTDDQGLNKRMDNSALSSGSVMLNTGFKIDNKNTIALTGWYQQYYREIPQALFESKSVKNQRDESLRLLLDWNRQNQRSNLYGKIAYLRDRMQYRDSATFMEPDNFTNQVYGETGLKYKLNVHHQFMVFTPIHISWIDSQLQNIKTQSKFAIAAAYTLTQFDERLQVSASARGEMINDLGVLLPGVNAAYAFTNWLTVRANVQRTFRAPTLHELYYEPGGNDKLKPEHGWSADAGYVIKTDPEKTVTFNHDLSVFNRRIHDWIIWFGGAIWTPHNIATVHSRGVETENSIKWRIGNWKFHLGLNTSYVLATTVESYLAGDGSVGKQIPYTPRYNGQVNIGATVKELYFNYNHTYTGYRFYTTDESRYVMPYSTGNLQLFYTAYIRSMPLQISAQCNNIWNETYQVVNARPMPGTNWLLGVRATLAN